MERLSTILKPEFLAEYYNKLLTEPEAARFLNISPRTLQKWRLTGEGPPFIRVGLRNIRYRRLDLVEWSEAQKHQHTASYGPDTAR